MKELFKQYLTKIRKQKNGKFYTSSTAENYCSAITYLSMYFKLKIWYIEDVQLDEIDKIINKISVNGIDEIAGDIYSKAGRTSITLYKDFREYLIQNPEFIRKNKSDVAKANERFLEEIIENNFSKIKIFENFIINKKQFKSNNFRYDFLLEHKSKDEFIIVEIKDTPILPDSITQLVVYINDFKSKNRDKNIKGVLIGHFLTESAKEFFNNNIKNCDIDFYSFNIAITLDEINI